MKKFFLFAVAALIGGSAAYPQDSDRAQQLAREVFQASGGDNWAKVKRMKFTFLVEENGKELARAQHDWDLAGQTDRVVWKDKDVTVNLAAPGEGEEAKAAYARWVNDSYWLLAPLKVLDPGVKLEHLGQRDCGGATCEALQLSFDQVGLTPGDKYVLYVDPQTKLVRAWDYQPSPEKTMHGTWEKYEDHGGLKLSTHHEFGGKVIRFADISVE